MIESFIKGYSTGFRAFGHLISGLVNAALLTAVYFTAVAMTAIAARLTKKQFLELHTNPKAKTYWTRLDLKKRPTEEYYRQF